MHDSENRRKTHLLNDVLPGTRSLQANQLIIQSLAHTLDTRTHNLQVLVPVGDQFLAVHNLLNDAASNARAHGELATDQVAKIVDDNITDGSSTAVKNVVIGTNTLAVKAEILGETLRHAHLHIGLIVEEVAHCPGVLLDGAGGKALVCGIKEGEELLTLAEVCDGHPLLLARVQTGGVVCAGVQQHGVALLGFRLECGHHALEVKGPGSGVVVWVCLAGNIGQLPDSHVVRP